MFFLAGNCRDMEHLFLLFLSVIFLALFLVFLARPLSKVVSTWALVHRFFGCRDIFSPSLGGN